ncbi:hypothetical protein [Paenibacillus terrae]|uniref:hypothetical protein n=1 Tax=Paenibacillus terrae TaxID=159743 RepID=UPI00191118F9|nr:hypothetical protein [Paenibacillus terrae]
MERGRPGMLFRVCLLARFKPSLLAVGHGNLLEHPQDSLERAIQEMERQFVKK